MDRYEIQMKLAEIGSTEQKKLQDASVAIVGLGGLGAPSALYLAGAGVGHLKLIDGDTVSLTNLHRQVIYREKDIGKPKVEAAASHLTQLNSGIKIQAVNAWLNPQNIDVLFSDIDLILDCTDRFFSRFLINRFCVAHKKSWVFASCDRWTGQVALFSPQSACLACLFSRVQDGLFQDCSEAGVLGATVGAVAMFQTQLALQWLLGMNPNSNLHIYDAKELSFHSFQIQKQKKCQVCGKHTTEKLSPEDEQSSSLRQGDLCGSASEIRDFRISWQEASKLIQKDPAQYVFIDLRHTSAEDLLSGKVILSDKNKTYFLYCEHQIKSPFVRDVLRQRGYPRVYVLERNHANHT